MITRDTCKRCRGRGLVFTRTGGGPCPVCGGNGNRGGMARLQAINAAGYCWSAFARGQTGMVNLEMAVAAVFRDGVPLAELCERIGAPEKVIAPIYAKLDDPQQPLL